MQGLGAAIVLPLSLTILTTAFPVQRRGMIVGIYGGLAGLAVALGPIIGGAVTQGIDWHWIFWINVPIGAAALPLAMRLLPDSYGAQERLDPLGVTLVTSGIVAIVWALVRADQAGWASAEIVSCLAGGAVLLLAFAAWEHRVSEPMLPLRLFRSPAFTAGNATTFLMTGAIFAAGFLVTQEFQLARGYSPVSAGVRRSPSSPRRCLSHRSQAPSPTASAVRRSCDPAFLQAAGSSGSPSEARSRRAGSSWTSPC